MTLAAIALIALAGSVPSAIVASTEVLEVAQMTYVLTATATSTSASYVDDAKMRRICDHIATSSWLKCVATWPSGALVTTVSEPLPVSPPTYDAEVDVADDEDAPPVARVGGYGVRRARALASLEWYPDDVDDSGDDDFVARAIRSEVVRAVVRTRAVDAASYEWVVRPNTQMLLE